MYLEFGRGVVLHGLSSTVEVPFIFLDRETEPHKNGTVLIKPHLKHCPYID